MGTRRFWLFILLALLLAARPIAVAQMAETAHQHDERMQWWREARFGMFIHWGLYAILAGQWGDKTNYGEWIRNNARIPIEVYDTLVGHFNPVKFNADEWVSMAKNAGMRYIVLTSKHHDGFALFDSKVSDFDVMRTPFGRDIVKELADACRRQGIVFCVYHSIMDWHHPDYLPRRLWETDRSAEGADYDRYVAYMKAQLKELLTQYGTMGVLWFDGEWESTWTEARGTDLYAYVRSLQPGIIINNRVGAARAGMSGMTAEGGFGGDFGTPEQEVPPTGLPGVDWESCMTMNENWGYNRADTHFKSTTELVRTLVDIASKGGNYLLNVGPKADGTFPEESIDRLKGMGEWMSVNGESIYGTTASPFANLPWGRSTQKAIDGGTMLYLHVFDWPSDGVLRVPGLLSMPRGVRLLADASARDLVTGRDEDALLVTLPLKAPSAIDAVIALSFDGVPDVSHPPVIRAEHSIFIDTMSVYIHTDRQNAEVRYTLDGSIPTSASMLSGGSVVVAQSGTVTARCFRNGHAVSEAARMTVSQVSPRAGQRVSGLTPGVSYSYFEGDWDVLPDFATMTPKKTGILHDFVFEPRDEQEHFGFAYEGYVDVPVQGVYVFHLSSDDGSRLLVDESMVVDNDGLHGMTERSGEIPLEKGFHRVRVEFFEKTGGDGLRVLVSGPGMSRTPLGNRMFTAGQP